jgi:hypothetical protein
MLGLSFKVKFKVKSKFKFKVKFKYSILKTHYNYISSLLSPPNRECIVGDFSEISHRDIT